MSFQLVFDTFGADAGTGHGVPGVEAGLFFFAFGWIADPVSGAPKSIRAYLDGATEIAVRRVDREDVANHLGNRLARNCGFDAGFSTAALASGLHTFVLAVEDAAGNLARSSREFVVEPAKQDDAAYTRVLIAGAPKSGSTYTWHVLSRYLSVGSPPLEGLFHEWEPNLDSWVLERLAKRSYVIGMHLKAYESNLSAIRENGISTIVTWRNIADTLVSLDDHIRREGGRSFAFYADNDKYLAMPEQERYRFLIRYYAPWCVSFYLGWKHAGMPFFHYDRLAADPLEYVCEIVERLTGARDGKRVAETLKVPALAARLNVGRSGRSTSKFAAQTKALLEELLENHCEPLDELLSELPWRSGSSSGASIKSSP